VRPPGQKKTFAESDKKRAFSTPAGRRKKKSFQSASSKGNVLIAPYSFWFCFLGIHTMTSFHLLGPIYLKESTNAFLGLEISSDHLVEPVVVVWFSGDPNDGALEQIKQEAQAATLLKHPNILKLHGVYELNGRLARVVDYVDGEPLRRFLEVEKSLPVPFAARIICDAAEGIHYAHTVVAPPWVHGALRPETLMLSFSGLVRVSGYGARVFAPKKPLEPRFRGRRKHLAPEQIIGGESSASPQTDIYLLGLCLYECITGMLPFIAETNFDEAVLTRPLPPMPPETPSALETVITKACAKKAEERYASALEFRQAILSAVGVLPSHEELAASLNTWVPLSEKSRNHRQQLMDEGLNQILSQHPFKPKLNPEDLIPPPVVTDYLPHAAIPLPPPAEPEEHLGYLRPPEEPAVSPDAMTLPPFKVGPSDTMPPAAAAPIFVSQKATRRPPPPYEEEEEEFEPKSSTAAWSWAVGGFIAACAVFVIVYFTVLAPPVPSKPAVPAKALPPVAALPPPAPPPAPAQPEETTPEPASKTAQKSKPAAAKGKAPAASAAPAQVHIRSEMPLDISFKGKHIGKTPAQVSVPPGKATFLLSNKSAGIRTRRHMELKPGQTANLNVHLEKGVLNVNAPVGAQILVNGVLKGTAPMGDIELWEGDHRLLVKHNGATLSQSFSLAPGGYMNYDVTQTSN
jgi:serine/threonine-protein kinase